MISAKLLEQMRRTERSMMTTPCQVLRNHPARAADGGDIDQFKPVANALGRFWVENNALVVQGESEDDVSDWRGKLPWNTDCRRGDQITVGGQTLEVTGTDAGRTDPICLNLTCKSTQ